MHAGPRVRLAASYQELMGDGLTGGACNTPGGTGQTTPAVLALLVALLCLRLSRRRVRNA